MNLVQFVVGAIRVMVKQDHMLHSRRAREFPDAADDAVSPAALMRHIRVDILGIVDQDVRAPAECGKRGIAEDGRIRRIEFVVGNINDGSTAKIGAEAVGFTGVVDADSRNAVAVVNELLDLRVGIVIHVRP